MWSEVAFPVIVIAILITANGFFVAAEFAIAAAPRARVAHYAGAGSAAARRVLQVLTDNVLLNRYIATAQIGITLASLGMGMYGEHVLASWILIPLEHYGWLGVAAAHTVATIVAVAILTYLHVVIGEMVPKSLALQSPAETAVRLSSTMALTERLLRPLTVMLDWSGTKILRLAGIPVLDAEARLVSTAELEYIVEESSESGYLEPRQQLYLENVIDFHERTVGQVMTPRTRMAALPLEATKMEALATVCENRYSRYPVYDSDRDNVVGILHIKDIARMLTEANGEYDLGSLIRPPNYVPESLALDEMLNRFRIEHVQIAIVLDEYGGTAGLVTIEDLAEDLIGEIQDEFDEEVLPFEEIAAYTIRVRGDLLLDELNQHFDIRFEEEQAETVGGLIMTRLGNVAAPGDRIEYQGLWFTVETVDGLAVTTAIMEMLPEEQTETPKNDEPAE